ncbi:hypothetical protein EBR21_01895 [bacterium]|nr:hypothetical protein [bacterium]
MRLERGPAIHSGSSIRNYCSISVTVSLTLLICASCKPKSAEQELNASSSVQSVNGVDVNLLWPAIKSASFGVLSEDYNVHLDVQTHSEHSTVQAIDYLTKLPNLLRGERFGGSDIFYSDFFLQKAQFSPEPA